MPGEFDNETAIAVPDRLVGTIFDKRFRIDERLAAGGFGAIYRATHVKSNLRFALKIMHPNLASDLGVLARFRREGAALTSLRCPHTITAYEIGQVDTTLFIVLELLHGESLFERYSMDGPFEWKRVMHIARQVCESLEEAHALGIVHRDLKPTNIHLEDRDGDRDYVKVLDFGIAKIMQGSDLASDDLTNAGQMIGTLDYMSPEQMVGGQVSGQTDIYTLGIVMYEMIAGALPFPEAASPAAALAAVLKTTPPPLRRRAPVPPPVDALVMRCLDRDMHRRYRHVAELRADIEHVLAEVVPSMTSTVQLAKEHLQLDDDQTALAPPSDSLIELARTPPSDSLTELTTPPLSESATGLTKTIARDAARPVQAWEDFDEHAATTALGPHDEPRGAHGQMRATPRPLGRQEPLAPQVVVAPFSPKPRPPIIPDDMRALAGGGHPTMASPADPAPDSFSTTMLGHALARRQSEPPMLGAVPATPIPRYIPTASTHVTTAKYDMATVKAREAVIRRLVWLIVIVLGIGAGFLLATLL